MRSLKAAQRPHSPAIHVYSASVPTALPRRLPLSKLLTTGRTSAYPASSGGHRCRLQPPQAFPAAPEPWSPRDQKQQQDAGAHQPPWPHLNPALHPATASFDSFLLAAQDAAEDAGDSVKAAATWLRRLRVWLGRPESVLIREGCQLLACLLFILLYVWRWVAKTCCLSGGGWQKPVD